MAEERAFSCGSGKYYVTERSGYFIVQKQEWVGKSFVAYAHDLGEAVACIERDAGCWSIRAA